MRAARSSRKSVVVLSGLTAVALAALSACGGSSDDDTAKGVSTVNVTMASGSNGDECTYDATTAKAGPITFNVKNESATGVSEFEVLQDQKIVGERENLAPGLGGSTFTVTLGGGTYQMYCPGASNESTDLTVTGAQASQSASSTQQLLQQGASDYAKYASDQITNMITAVQVLKNAVDSGDVKAAQDAYAAARPFYERVESDVEGFVLDGYKPTDNHGNLDYLIDMRASNLDPAVGWHGFHAIERDIFAKKKITGSTKKLAGELLINVVKLSQLSQSLTYKPEDLANGAAGLLEEVQSGKISGEEEKYSHIDLVDFAANVEGAEQSFAYLKPGLEKIDPDLTDTISQRFDAVTSMLDGYRDAKELGGYERYTPELKASDANKLSQTVQALQDSLSTIAAKVATA